MSFSVERKGSQLRVAVPKEHAIGFSLAFAKLEGHKRILPNATFSFEPTGSNIRLLAARFPQLEGALLPVASPVPAESTPLPEFRFRVEPYDYQREFYAKASDKPAFALFADPGTGKTKMAIDRAFMLHAAGKIDAVIVIANKGVHQQWVKDALPEHAPENIPWSAYCHDYLPKTGYKAGHLNFLSVNYDGAKGAKAQAIMTSFLANARSVMLVIDESQNIKNKQSGRWKVCHEVRRKCRYAMIMSGTPIAKNLVDYWSQYFMLDEAIIGDRYLTSFRAKYCVMGGFDNKQIVGFQNEAQLYRMTEPYTYRISKSSLQMPPKRYKTIAFDMAESQRKVYDMVRDTFVSSLTNPEALTMANAGVALTRLQQITCGYFPNEDGTVSYFDNPRLEALDEALALEGIEGKVVIWARFHHDIELVARHLGESAVTYYGKTDDRSRALAKQRFIEDPSVRYMVSSPEAGGAGIDGYQLVSSTAVYYSNSFNSLARWQSEDRIHRKGMVGESALYLDLVCRGGLDRKLLRNLRDKKSLSDLMLDDLREFFDAKSNH